MTDRDAGYREGIEAELLPCPFCGNKNIRVCSNGIGDFYAICTGEDDEPHCGASCSEINCETEAKAVRRWNTRALPLSSTPDDGKAEPGFRQWVEREGKYITLWMRTAAGTHFRHSVELDSGFGDVFVELEQAIAKANPSPASDGAIREALDAYRFYIDASDRELAERGISREDALRLARELDPYDGVTPTALSAHAGDAAKSGDKQLCAGGIDPGFDACPKCGATDDEHCQFDGPPDTHAEVKG